MKKILIIDDQASILMVLKSFLRTRFEVVTQQNPEEGIKYLQQGESVDLLIIDLSMPKLDGLEFTQIVRASGAFCHIPIMILSASEDSATRVKCLNAGADDFIVKPFNPEEVLARINSILRRSEYMSYVKSEK